MEDHCNVVHLPTARTLRRALAQERIPEAKCLVEQAQALLDRAAQELCPIVGGASKHRRVGALSERCRAMWHVLDRYERTGRYLLDYAARGHAGAER